MKSMRERILAQQQLMKFYQVDTLADLIEAQAKHIERLQQKLGTKATWMYVANNRQG